MKYPIHLIRFSDIFDIFCYCPERLFYLTFVKQSNYDFNLVFGIYWYTHLA